MRIRDRLAKLEAARVSPIVDDCYLRPIFQLEGQSEEEAHCLSEFADHPIETCFMLTEAMLRRLYLEIDGDYELAEKDIEEIRAKQEARRADL